MNAEVITREEFLKNLEEREELKTAKKNTKRKVKNIEDVDSSSNESIPDILHDDDDKYDGIETLQDLAEAEKSDEEEDDISDPQIDSWVIVTYSTKKSLRRYVGKVLNIKEESAEVKFVKKYKSYFVWPDIDDIDTVSLCDIYKVIRAPTEGRRGQIYFALSFDGLNIE